MDARCEKCNVVLPDADLRGLIMAEEGERYWGVHLGLLCMICFHRLQSGYPEEDDDEPQVWSF